MKAKRWHHLFSNLMLLRILIFLSVNLIVLINIMRLRSPIVGFLSSIIYVYMISALCGNIFFEEEKRWNRVLFGLAVFVTLLAIAGTIALVFYQLSTEVIVFILFSMSSVVIFFNVKKCGFKALFVNTRPPSLRQRPREKGPKRNPVFRIELIPLILYVMLVSICFFLLLISRSDGVLVFWDVVHPAFLPLFFIATFILLIVVFSKAANGVKLLLVIIHSLLVHSFLVIVLHHGYHGDIWRELGLARDLYNVGKDLSVPGLSNLFDYLRSGLSPFSVLFFLFRKHAYYVLVTIFAKMFGVDIYWSQAFLTPLLWGILVPFFLLNIMRMLGGRKNIPTLTAFLSFSIPLVIWWGTVSVPDTVSDVFFVFSAYLLLKYLSSRESSSASTTSSLFLILIATSATFLSNFRAGTIAVVMFLLVFAFQKYETLKRKSVKFARNLLIISASLCASVLPLGLIAMNLAWIGAHPLGGIQFSVNKLLSTDIWSLIFAEYVNISQGELLLTGLIPLLGIVGLIYIMVYSPPRRYSRNLCLFLLVVEVILVLDYRILKYGMLNLPFTPERIWVERDLLLLPFAAVMLDFLIGKIHKLTPKAFSIRTLVIRKHSFKYSLIVLVSCFFLSGFIMEATKSAYALKPLLTPTSYEIEAIYFIDRNTQGNYVVISDQTFVYIALGIFGFNSRGTYTRTLFYEMLAKPSVENMRDAMKMTNSSVGYFVISTRYAQDFSRVVASAREIFDIYGVFGDGKLYIFSYPTTQREFAIPVKIDSGNFTRVDYPIEYEMNLTQTMGGFPMGHLDSNSIRVIAPNGEEVPSDFEHFQAWLEDCSSLDNWLGERVFSDGDVLNTTIHFTSKTPEIGRLTYTKFEKDKGNLTIDVQHYKYMEIKWKANPENVANIRLDFWYKVANESKEVPRWAQPLSDWSILQLDISSTNGSLNGLWIDAFDARPGDWVGDYTFYIDWIRFVSDAGTVRWLYNSSANTMEQYRIMYDFLENTDTGNGDGFPNKYVVIPHSDGSIPPPTLYTWILTPVNLKAIDILGQPLSDVEVKVDGLDVEAHTDIDGWASVVVPQGQWTFVFSKSGATNRKTVEALVSTGVIQSFSFVRIGTLLLTTWEFILLVSLVAIGALLSVIVLHKKVLFTSK